MNTAHRLEFFTDVEGYPWACFAWGDVPPESITRERIAEAAAYYHCLDEEALALEEFQVRSLWICAVQDDYGPTQEGSWKFCRADEDGAQRITGVRFQ
ncbi:hypothetical protein [Paracoccus sp. KR1-242]|uniref:hypothetical protein n=1 Tax=Paracoccus sp. KR1-242 TaxID=3410028 RepID=UPI003C0267A4